MIHTRNWPSLLHHHLYFFDPRHPAPRAAGRAPVLVRGGAINRRRERTRKTVSAKCKHFFSKNMKVIESYWKDTAAVWENTNDSIINVSDF